jgi:hypothetical protein
MPVPIKDTLHIRIRLEYTLNDTDVSISIDISANESHKELYGFSGTY